MKRHPAIQPLSRQHHTLLLAVLLLKKGLAKNAPLPDMISFLNRVWMEVLESHTIQEESILIPLFDVAELKAENQSVLNEHKELELLYQKCNSAGATKHELQLFVELLEKHIRFEERHYFPKLESLADAETLDKLSSGLTEIPTSCLQFTPAFWE